MSDSPIPEPAESEHPVIEQRHALRWTSTVLATAALFLLVFNATALANWSAALNPTDLTVQVASVAAAWEADTAKFGLNQPRAIVHNAWANARAMTFGQHGRAGADEPPPG